MVDPRKRKKKNGPIEALVTSAGPWYSSSSLSKYQVPIQPPTTACDNPLAIAKVHQ